MSLSLLVGQASRASRLCESKRTGETPASLRQRQFAKARGSGMIMLSRPADPAGFLLESTGSLTPPVSWQEVTDGITENGGIKSYTVTNNPGVPVQLYRLRLP